MGATFESLDLGKIVELDYKPSRTAGELIHLCRADGGVYKRGTNLPSNVALTSVFEFGSSLTPTQLYTRFETWLNLTSGSTLVLGTAGAISDGSRPFTLTNCVLEEQPTQVEYHVGYNTLTSKYEGFGTFSFNFTWLGV